MSDVLAGEAVWSDAGGSVWTPECWHKSPQQMQDEAKAGLFAMYQSLAGPAKKHNNPVLPPNRMRLL